MEVFLSIIKAIVGYFIILFIGTNLIGMIVRGLYQPKLPSYTNNPDLPQSNEVSIKRNVGIVFLIITIILLFLEFNYLNIGVVIATLMIILPRIPDVIFEIKTGQKINSTNMPKGPIDILGIILLWAALPVLWYSLYTMNNH